MNDREEPGSAFVAVLGHLMGKLVADAAGAGVELGLFRELGEAPRTAADLSKAIGASVDGTGRLLRALAAVGLVGERTDGFVATPLSRVLGPGGGAEALARMVGSRWHVGAWSKLAEAIRTGRSGFELAFGEPMFAYLAHDAEAAGVFVATMSEIAAVENPAVVEALSFEGHAVIADVGGGDGALLEAVLGANPSARGVLFDRAAPLAAARRRLEAAGLLGRCDLVEGDFFGAVPPADCFVLKHVIHDFGDDDAAKILRNVKIAARSGATVIVVEQVLEPLGRPTPAALHDLDMLVLTGGRERTEAELAALFARAGFQLDRVVATRSGSKVLVAT
jgi:hypothetical protein